jgi:hypothetical protein
LNKLIKTVLENPQYIDELVESGLLNENESKKLSLIKSVWDKTQQIPWKSIQNEFDISLEEADEEYFFKKIEEVGVFNFNLALKDRVDKGFVSEDEIVGLQDLYLKKFTNIIEHSFEISDIKQSFTAFRDKKKAQNEKVVKSYYMKFDNALDGGFRSGGIYCFMGPTGTYKSTFLTNFARSMWENDKNILYITTEMSEIDTMERILKSYICESDLDTMGVRILNESTIPKGKIKVVKVHPYDTRPKELIKIIQELGWKPDCIFVDYADELLPDKKSDNEYDGQGIIYAGLKTIGEIFECPILTATQTNREALEKGTEGTKQFYGMEAISDSSKKARLMDALFAIIRTDDDKIHNTLHLHTVKSRFSGHGKINFTIKHTIWRLDEDLGMLRNIIKQPIIPQKEYTFIFIDSYDTIDIFNKIKDFGSKEEIEYLQEKKRGKYIDEIDYKKIKEEITHYRNTFKGKFEETEDKHTKRFL